MIAITVNTTWTDPTSATLDKTTNDTLAEAYFDALASNFNAIGGATGRRSVLRREWAKGADVASAATTALGTDGNLFDITGTTEITSITILLAGTVVMLQFDGALKVVDGSNLLLGGDFYTAAGSAILLVSDGTNWIELARFHGGAITGSNILSGDVAMPVANTFYDGPSLSLAAGTWLILGGVFVVDSAGGTQDTAKLWNGATTIAATQHGMVGGGSGYGFFLTGITTLTGTETWKISVASDSTTSTVKAAPLNNSPGNYASHLVAVRLA